MVSLSEAAIEKYRKRSFIVSIRGVHFCSDQGVDNVFIDQNWNLYVGSAVSLCP